MYLPLIGAFLEAAGVILEKNVLKTRGFDYRNYTVFCFLALVVLMAPFLLWLWKLDSAFFSLRSLSLFFIVVVAALGANLLTFYSLKRKRIGDYEPLWLMQPLFIIVLAVIFYPSERNWMLVLLAFIASISLVLMHIKKHHLDFDRYLIAGILGSFLFALELAISKPLLMYFSPLTFYFVRCFSVFIFALLLYRPSFKRLPSRAVLGIVTVAALWVLYRVILYYGYESLGVVYTTLLFILSPVLMLVFAVVFLKEKITLRQLITNAIIIACVVTAIVVQKLY